MDLSFDLNICGVTFDVYLPDPAWRSALVEHYDLFLGTGQAAPWRVDLRYEPAVEMADRPWIRHDGARSEFHIARNTGWLDLSIREGAISAPSLKRAVSALDRILSYICMQALPREHDGILLHAAGLLVGDRGFVFAGASGVGKTTVAKLGRQAGLELLTDENVILREGQDRSWDLYSTPFWGNSTPPDLIRRVRQSAPLQAIYMLEHAPENRLELLSPGQGVARLLTTEKVAVERTQSAKYWLDMAERLVQSVPVFRLGFRPSSQLWPFLSRNLDNLAHRPL